jgi:hypothetical protein
LGKRFKRSDAPVILLQYTDNEQWVGGTVRLQIVALLPEAEILLVPLSLTSGVHMGPGTWSIAFSTLLMNACHSSNKNSLNSLKL